MSQGCADRNSRNADFIDLRIKPPPLAAVARGKVSVWMLFKVRLRRLTSNSLRSHSRVSLPARLPAILRRPPSPACDRSVRISFQASHDGELRNFDTEQPFPYCYGLQPDQSLEGVANQKTVADLKVRPGSQIALT